MLGDLEHDGHCAQGLRKAARARGLLPDTSAGKRLRLVAKLKRNKEEHGIGFVDLAREQWMLQYLQRANRGPLSEEGLAELYHELLDLMKREVTKEAASSEG